MYSEFASRRAAVKSALKEMVLHGHVIPYSSKNGIQYQITALGRNVANQLEGEYAAEYLAAAKILIETTQRLSERELIVRVNKKSADALRGDDCSNG